MSTTIVPPPVQPELPSQPPSKKIPTGAWVGFAILAGIIFAVVGLVVASHSGGSHAKASAPAVKVLPQTVGPRNLGSNGPAQLNGNPANMQSLAAQPNSVGPRNLGSNGPAQLNGSPANMQSLAAQPNLVEPTSAST